MWTQEKISMVTDLWRRKRSLGEIALIFGVSRSAIAGKIKRLGLLGQGAPKSVRRQTPRPPRRRKPVYSPFYAKALPLTVQSDAAQRSFNSVCGPSYDLMDLTRSECRWPIGNPGEEHFCYCAAPVKKGPYCPHHAAVAYQPR